MLEQENQVLRLWNLQDIKSAAVTSPLRKDRMSFFISGINAQPDVPHISQVWAS